MLFRKVEVRLNLRKIIFWSHLIVGVTVASVVLMMSVTGVLLTYEMQINRWDLRRFRAPTAMDTSSPVAVDRLLRSVLEFGSDFESTSITIRSDNWEPASVRVDNGLTLFVDRYSGAVVGDNDRPVRRFLRTVMYVHRWFAFEGDSRTVARAVTGAANLAFLFLIVSGSFLWWPRKWSRATLRLVIWFQSGLSGKARDFNWHNVIGAWMALPLIVIVISGASISYRWVGNGIDRLMGDQPSVSVDSEPSARVVTATERNSEQARDYISFQQVFERSINGVIGWRAVTIRIPEEGDRRVVASVDRGNGRQPSRQFDLVFDRTDGTLIERAGYPTYSRGRKIRRWLRFAHTGEIYGPVGQSIAGVATAGSIVLVWTGLAMTWRRFVGRRQDVSRRNRRSSK